jgi:hypothetical protein
MKLSLRGIKGNRIGSPRVFRAPSPQFFQARFWDLPLRIMRWPKEPVPT